MPMRIICIGEETEFGYIHVTTGVNCDDYENCLRRNEENKKRTTKTPKPECVDCGIFNPNSQSE